MRMILPGETIGVLGGGQLGRMFAQAAARMGYRVHVFDPERGCPAGAVAVKEVNAAFTDEAALAAFAAECAVVTYEFENIPVGPLLSLKGKVCLRPGPEILHIAQNRLREKTWLLDNGFPHARFVEAGEGVSLADAVAAVGFPCVVKTADFGYDGKGQMKLKGREDVASAEAAFAGKRSVVEAWIGFECEVSVVVARGVDGETKAFPVTENIHVNHVLSRSIVPARIGANIAAKATALAVAIADRLGLVGLIGVEMFITKDGKVLVNEIAPRPHNSGHFSMDACAVSQFEQQVRAVCGLPLGEPALLSPAVMGNILGDAWQNGTPDWAGLLKEPGVVLHLYGKREPRTGRKMGHFTVIRDSVEEAIEISKSISDNL